MGTGSRPPTAGYILLPSGQPRNIAQTARMTSLRATPVFFLLLSLTALLRPLSAHDSAVAIAVPVEGTIWRD